MQSSGTESIDISDAIFNTQRTDVLFTLWKRTQHLVPGHELVTLSGSSYDKTIDVLGYLREIGQDEFLDGTRGHFVHTWSSSDGHSNFDTESNDGESRWMMGDDSGKSGSVMAQLRTGSAITRFQGHTLDVHQYSWRQEHHEWKAIFICDRDSPSDEVGKQLAAEVHLWALRLDKELWTFTHQWQKSKALYASVQATNESDLILSPELLKRLHRDTNTFFESRDIYKSINAPWKRGLLLIGPPGNGKTGALQVLLKSMSHIPVLYVKSCGHAPPSISAIFGKARQTSPCILVFEDLDALINDMTRAYFLNEVDGLENNDGILMIATTNHPERIDDAIMKRPSRFDSKYIFGLPDHNLRKRFILKWLYEKVRDTSIDFDSREYSNPGVSDIDSLADHIASKTEGWSFAFLKELFISFLLSKAAGHLGDDPTAAVPYQDLLKHVEDLQEQVLTKGGADERKHADKGRSRPAAVISSARPMYP